VPETSSRKRRKRYSIRRKERWRIRGKAAREIAFYN
jgi:hypothetical protein